MNISKVEFWYYAMMGKRPRISPTQIYKNLIFGGIFNHAKVKYTSIEVNKQVQQIHVPALYKILLKFQEYEL